MKYLKIYFFIFGLLLLLASACQKPNNSIENSKLQELSFTTGSTTGTYFPLGGAIATVLNNQIEDISVTIQPSNASVENINLLSVGKTDMALAMNSIADQAYKGGSSDFPEPITNFYAIGVIYPEIVHIITTQDNGINNISQLKGKRINPGPIGSGTYSTAIDIMNSYNIDPFKETTLLTSDFAEIFSGLKAGQVDVAFAVLPFPATAVVNIATAKPITILSIDQEHFNKLQEQIPFATQVTIKSGYYAGQSEDIETIGLQSVLYVRDGFSKEFIYTLTKTLYENTEQISKGHIKGEQININNALNGITTPIHPGAQMYFDEIGLK